MQDFTLFIQSHPTLFLSLLGLVFVAACIEYVRNKQQAARITPAAAVLLINREQATVLDIRSKEAWETGHITGAISLPLSELQQNDKKIDKFRARPVIIACANGAVDSVKAAAQLQQLGLDSRILAGGMQAWVASGLPVIRS